MPWCPRCGTGISEHEIVTEGYQDRTHLSLFVGYPIVERPGEELMVWTTTPWTLAANVAAAVNPELTYVRLKQGERIFYVGKDAVANALKGEYEILGELKGSDLIGLTFRAPFDDFPGECRSAAYRHPMDRCERGRRHRHRSHRSRLRARKTSSFLRSTIWTSLRRSMSPASTWTGSTG